MYDCSGLGSQVPPEPRLLTTTGHNMVPWGPSLDTTHKQVEMEMSREFAFDLLAGAISLD